MLDGAMDQYELCRQDRISHFFPARVTVTLDEQLSSNIIRRHYDRRWVGEIQSRAFVLN